MRKNLFVPSKKEYVKGKKPDVECILCAIKDRNPEVENLEISETKNFMVTVNLYPYNPGHLMLFPKRHIESTVYLNDEEALELHHLMKKTMKILDKNYQPHGYNIGYNIGEGSGASIPHIHMHIVPRYNKESGFVDILSNSKIIIEDPRDTLKNLKADFAK